MNGPRREYKYSYHNTLHCLFHTTLQDMTISSRFCPVFRAWILVFRVWCRVSLCWVGLVCVDLHWLLCDEMEWGLWFGGGFYDSYAMRVVGLEKDHKLRQIKVLKCKFLSELFTEGFKPRGTTGMR